MEPTRIVYVLSKQKIDGIAAGEVVALPEEVAEYYQNQGIILKRADSPNKLKAVDAEPLAKSDSAPEPTKATPKKTAQGDK